MRDQSDPMSQDDTPRISIAQNRPASVFQQRDKIFTLRGKTQPVLKGNVTQNIIIIWLPVCLCCQSGDLLMCI